MAEQGISQPADRHKEQVSSNIEQQDSDMTILWEVRAVHALCLRKIHVTFIRRSHAESMLIRASGGFGDEANVTDS